MAYFSFPGGVVEQSQELDSHRYLLNRNETVDSLEELKERVEKARERIKWVVNDGPY